MHMPSHVTSCLRGQTPGKMDLESLRQWASVYEGSPNPNRPRPFRAKPGRHASSTWGSGWSSIASFLLG